MSYVIGAMLLSYIWYGLGRRHGYEDATKDADRDECGCEETSDYGRITCKMHKGNKDVE